MFLHLGFHLVSFCRLDIFARIYIASLCDLISTHCRVCVCVYIHIGDVSIPSL